jgi:hypothetical protein
MSTSDLLPLGPVEGAHIEIVGYDLEARGEKPSLRKIYKIRYQCCGKLAVMSQRAIHARRKEGSVFCVRCGSLNKSKPKPKVKPAHGPFTTGPIWPVPGEKT